MTSKLLALVHSKVALAVIGVALVGGGGGAIVAANHAQIPFMQSTAQSTHTPDANDNTGNHAHTVAIEGKLTAYNATGGTISVQTDDSKSATVIKVDSNTRVNGVHASSLKDLTSAVGDGVEVQATKQSDNSLLAWKITVQGENSNNGNGTGDNGSHNGQHDIAGTIAALGTGSFTLSLPDGTTKTVTVSASTLFAGTAHSFKDLTKGMHVTVEGTDQANGTFAATRIVVAGGE